MKKLSLILGLAWLMAFRAAAQISVEVVPEQDQFLPSESVPVAVKITNRSGQTLHLGADPTWLTFAVESADGFIVAKNAEVPVIGEFNVGSSQVATKHVDLKPCFILTRPGRYRIVATVRIKGWAEDMTSPAKNFDIISGVKLWMQDFGMAPATGPTNQEPEVRKYTLEQANYLKEQLRLYVQVSDAAEDTVYKVTALGPMVSFSRTEAQVDRSSRLNVLWQAGASSFSYSIVNPDGTVAVQDYYDNFYSRPRLTVNENGDVVVLGGTRRPKPTELPIVKPPNQLPPLTKPVMPQGTN